MPLSHTLVHTNLRVTPSRLVGCYGANNICTNVKFTQHAQCPMPMHGYAHPPSTRSRPVDAIQAVSNSLYPLTCIGQEQREETTSPKKKKKKKNTTNKRRAQRYPGKEKHNSTKARKIRRSMRRNKLRSPKMQEASKKERVSIQGRYPNSSAFGSKYFPNGAFDRTRTWNSTAL